MIQPLQPISDQAANELRPAAILSPGQAINEHQLVFREPEDHISIFQFCLLFHDYNVIIRNHAVSTQIMTM